MKPTKVLVQTGVYEGVTHEGGKAIRLTDEQTLRRSVLACLLWEGTFYEDGQSAYERICRLAATVNPERVRALAVEARQEHQLRHVPLVLCRELLRRGELNEQTLTSCLQRADEPAQFLALLWTEGRCHVPRVVRRAIVTALPRWDEYQLAKWGRQGPITMRDIFRLCHPDPKREPTPGLWAKVVKQELAVPDTWEVAISGAGNKAVEWRRLIAGKRLGGLALLRNLRNLRECGIEKETVAQAMEAAQFTRVLPFRFLAAAKVVPQWEDIIDQAMLRQPPEARLPGETWLLVDVSGSMDYSLSRKSDLTRMDAACGVAILAREMCDECRMFTFSQRLVELPVRRGMALRDAAVRSQGHGGTYLARALEDLARMARRKPPERLVVVTDEQAHDDVQAGVGKRHYLVNVGTYEKGVGYGPWVRINGFSDAVLGYIAACERLDAEATKQ